MSEAEAMIATPCRKISRQESGSHLERAKPAITNPRKAKISTVSRVRPFNFSMAATMSAPQIDPAPEKTSNRVYVSGPLWKTVCTKTGRNAVRENPNNVVQNARTTKALIPSRHRMNRMPSAMLLRTGSWDLAGTNFTRIMKSVAITARYEMPLTVKHQVGPSRVYVKPPRVGPRMRAKLNWMEFMAIALARSSGPTRVGSSAE